MLLLDNPVRRYAWGSRTTLPRMLGRPVPSAEPEAELWMGAHPTDPSRIDGVGLDDYIAAAPHSTLGPDAMERFGARLPFLMKLLAADAPLSIQVHPDQAQARVRFEADNHNYLDPHHKPEMLVAYTRFEALCGFRDARESADGLRSLALPELSAVVDALTADEMRRALTILLTWPRNARRDLVARVVAARAALPRARADMTARLAARFPDDPGVIVAFLLRHIVLAPGEAIYVPAGQLHSYLGGTGIEIMASSDNVLRGGLTPKHVDVDELVATVAFGPAPEPRIAVVRMSDTVESWPVPVADFRLCRVRHAHAETITALTPDGPRIAFCVSGSFDVSDTTGTVRLRTGESAFSAASGREVRMHGRGELFLASL